MFYVSHKILSKLWRPLRENRRIWAFFSLRLRKAATIYHDADINPARWLNILETDNNQNKTAQNGQFVYLQITSCKSVFLLNVHCLTPNPNTCPETSIITQCSINKYVFLRCWKLPSVVNPTYFTSVVSLRSKCWSTASNWYAMSGDKFTVAHDGHVERRGEFPLWVLASLWSPSACSVCIDIAQSSAARPSRSRQSRKWLLNHEIDKQCFFLFIFYITAKQ